MKYIAALVVLELFIIVKEIPEINIYTICCLVLINVELPFKYNKKPGREQRFIIVHVFHR